MIDALYVGKFRAAELCQKLTERAMVVGGWRIGFPRPAVRVNIDRTAVAAVGRRCAKKWVGGREKGRK